MYMCVCDQLCENPPYAYTCSCILYTFTKAALKY